MRINLIFVFIMLSVTVLKAQNCSVEEMPEQEGKLNRVTLVEGDVNIEKTIRIIIHFPLKANGTGNFTHNTDYYGVVNNHNGYWMANKFVEQCNFLLKNNKVMTQQLSYKPPIPANLINVKFELAGVMFHKDDYLYKYKDLRYMSNSIVSSDNRDVVINVFLYADNNAVEGATYYGFDILWTTGLKIVYDDYLLKGNIAIDEVAEVAIHEVGHCLYLKHAKLGDNGKCCENDDKSCLDDCDDTPTYLELLNDGHATPCAWGASNNIMDYSPIIRAWTPCQIQKVHTSIVNRPKLLSCYFNQDTELKSVVITKNTSYIAKKVTLSDVTVLQENALFINSETVEIKGGFELKPGAILQINTKPNCN